MTTPGETSAKRLTAYSGVRRVPSPKVELFDRPRFLAPELCTRLIALIDQDRRPSTIADPNGDHYFRTSETCDLSAEEPAVRDLEALLFALNGIDPAPWNAANWPAWYAIGYSVMEPLSSIVLAPVWMLGLSLLYVDERVRHEGYDIELMAAQHLGQMPDINVTSPFAPAIVQSPGATSPPDFTSRGGVLGLR